jgi:hypothetical protein
MNVSESVYARLSGFAGLTALVGTRIYPVALDQDATMPAVVFRRLPAGCENVFGGSSGLGRPIFSISAWGSTLASAEAVRAQVRLAMDVSMVGLGGAGGVNAQVLRLSEPMEVLDTETGWYQVTEDYQVFYQE